MSQQVQEQVPTKSQPIPQNGQYTAFHASPWPTVLSASGKVLYGLGGLSVIASIGIWNRLSLPKRMPGARKAIKAVKTVKPSKEQSQESQRLGTFVGLLAPTFVMAGKALEDASARLISYEYEQWEKKQSEKVRTSFRFFGR